MEKMQYLKDYLSIIETVIPRGSKVIYLDYPLHLNVGDLLILKGTEQFFKSMEYDVLVRRSDRNSMHFVKTTDSIPSDVIIAIHGGGNFGDLYPAHQRLCEEVALKYKNNKIVVLPKTIHFNSEHGLIETTKILNTHTNLTIFCRDNTSHTLLKKYFSGTALLCPDMAQSLWGVFPNQQREDVREKLLLMIRRDIEKGSATELSNVYNATESIDWDDICSDFDRRCMRVAHLFEKMNRIIPGSIFPGNSLWYYHTDKLVARVNKIFMAHELVITSRMHGHILSCLLNVPNRIIDNSYGKNSGYFESWTKGTTGSELIRND